MSWRKKIIIIISAIAIIGIFDFWLWLPKRQVSNQPQKANDETKTEEKTAIEFFNNSLNQTNVPLPENNLARERFSNKTIEQSIIKPSVLLSVPFTSQSPYAKPGEKWDELYNEACEEAALIMARAWLKGEKLTAAKVDEEILQAVTWQEENWSGHYDLPVEKIVELAKNYFQIEKIYFEHGIDLNDIKKELSAGNLVLVPAAGRVLKNPYYRQPGPYYHMLVVIGYNEKEIITNDPGTKRGKGFKYSYQNFFEAIYDWPGPLGSTKDEVNILAGRKAMMVIER